MQPMNDLAIQADRVSKRYRIGSARERNRTFREALTNTIAAPWRSLRRQFQGKATVGNGSPDLIWALKDVSFEVRRGEAVGIIGRNGAGKSTLLKILSRITEPTEGRIVLRGRVGSLLEVGTGFHSELTGEENIYLSGTILGMSSQEISRKFDEIVAFSEMERFINTPVKHYSSGMYMRLAFAVAAHLEPEILLVDEVLAVGDAAFQRKCLGKMEHVAQEGRTVLFVSHNMTAVTDLCQKAILLENGQLAQYDDAKTVVRDYLSFNEELSSERIWDDRNPPGNEQIKLRKAYFVDSHGNKLAMAFINQEIGFCVEYEVLEDIPFFTHSINVFNETEVHLFTSHDDHAYERSAEIKRGRYRTIVWLPADLLQDGDFEFSFACMRYNPFIILFHERRIVRLKMMDTIHSATRHENYREGLPGLIRPKLKWDERKRVSDPS